MHAAELIQRKRAPPQANPLLPVYNRPATLKFDQNREKDHQRRSQHQQGCGKKNIKEALSDLCDPAFLHHVVQRNQLLIVLVDINRSCFLFPETTLAQHFDAAVLKMRDQTRSQAGIVAIGYKNTGDALAA